jgi:hypothetical protein
MENKNFAPEERKPSLKLRLPMGTFHQKKDSALL